MYKLSHREYKYLALNLFSIISSFLGIIFFNSYFFLVFNLTLGGINLIYSYFNQIVYKKNRIDIFFLFSFSIGFGYILSTCIYVLSSGSTELKEIFSDNGFGVDFIYYIYSINIILIVFFIMNIISILSGGLYFPKISLDEMKKNESLFYYASLFIVIIGFLFGRVGYRGVVNIDSGGVDAIAIILRMLIPLLIVLTVFKLKNKINWIIVGFLFILVGLNSRREILYLMISLPLIASMVGYDINYKFILKKIHYILISIVTLFIMSYFFVALRVATWSGEKFSSWSTFSIAIEYGVNNQEKISQYILETTSDRSFILNYFAILISKYNFNIVPQYGLEVIYSFLISLPSFIVDKNKLPSSMEEMMHPLYGIPVYDDANSILVSGINDFYLFGVVLYPIIFSIIFILFFKLFVNNKERFVLLAVGVFFVYGILPIESTLVEKFLILRNILIVLSIYYLSKFIVSAVKIR